MDAISGAAAAGCPDIGPYRRHLAALGPTRQPLWMAGVLNSWPVLRFDGVDDCIARHGPVFTGDRGSVFMVMSFNTAACVPWSAGKIDATANYYLEGVTLSGYPMQFFQQNNEATGDYVQGSENLAYNTWYILEWQSTGAAYVLRRNGVVQGITVNTGANSGDWFLDTTLRQAFAIGGRYAGPTPDLLLHGDFARGVVIDGAVISAGERTSLNAYLSDRYAVALV